MKKSPYERYIEMYNGKLPTEFDPKYLELLRMSKYRILSVPDVLPSKCANCGAAKEDGRKYVDIGLHIEWYGALFLCMLCLNDIAEEVGLFTGYKAELASVLREFKEIRDLVRNEKYLHDKVTELFKELNEHYSKLSAVRDDSASDSDSGMGTRVESSESGTNQTEQRTSTAKQRTSKPFAGPGSKTIPSLASLLESDS